MNLMLDETPQFLDTELYRTFTSLSRTSPAAHALCSSVRLVDRRMSRNIPEVWD